MMINSKFTMLIIVLTLFLISCNNKLPQGSGSVEPSISAAVSGDIISPAATVMQYTDYNNDFNSIQTTDGINIVRIKSIVNEINPEYFKGLNLLQAVYSNPDSRLNPADGMYYYDSKGIALWIYDESDGYIRYLLLHELKHHYCWNIMNENTDTHQGCFLDTPIDREYGFIK